VIDGDRSLARREPRLPGLATLLDDDAFAELLSTWLPGAGIRSARSTYVRYKPDTSLLVAYRVQSAAGEQLVHARAERDNAAGRLQRLTALADRPTALGPGVLVLPEQSLAVLPFPTDRRLPALRALADEAARSHLFGGSGGSMRVLAYKPERRFVARAGDLVLRAYAADGWPAAAGAVAALGHAPDVRIQEIRRVADAHQVIALAWMPGRPLERLLDAPGVSPAPAVAAALRALHACRPAGALPHRRGAWEAAALRAAGEAAGVAGPRLGRRARLLAARLAGELAARAPGNAVLHGDFSVDHVLIDERGAILLDLDAAALGHPVDDLASCLGDLELRVIEGGLERRRAEAFGGELAEIYAHRASVPVREDELNLLTGAALLRRVAEPFRRRRPDWPAAMEAIVGRAAELTRRPRRAGGPAPARPPLERLTRLHPRGEATRLPAGPLVVRRSWPAGAGRLLLEYVGSDGALVAGEWHHEGVAWPDAVTVQAGPGAPVTLYAGADPALPALARVLRRRGATLASHRPGRRATVRLENAGETLWVKVVWPGWATGVAETLERARQLTRGAFSVPDVRRIGAKAGTVTCGALPGRPLTAVLAEPGARRDVTRLGQAVRRFHDALPPPGMPSHDAEAEAALLERWVGDAAAVAPALAAQLAPAASAAVTGLAVLGPAPPAPLHRDLHDGQILLAPDGAIGVLDFEGLALGDPALDVASLLVHFELRAAQGACTASRAEQLRDALLWGYEADAGMLRRVAAYETAARLRLACVYAYRPQWREVPAALVGGVGRGSRAIGPPPDAPLT
jgi:aminoglycoside phosphotransferase (APT) family kinase protein